MSSQPRQAEPESIVSPEVHPDGRVTFRLFAPEARQVLLRSPELPDALGGYEADMWRGDDGVWTLTLGPLEPAVYDYAFVVDGLRMGDPASACLFGTRRGARGWVEVPSRDGSPRFDEQRPVPHGAMSQYWYDSPGGLPRRAHVYTPPGWRDLPREERRILYLLHGFGDLDSGWLHLGRVNVILDNLLADGRTVPFAVAMPDGMPLGFPAPDDEGWWLRALETFRGDVTEVLLPLMEEALGAPGAPSHRAIAGLSMGGAQTLDLALRRPLRFGWVAGFSSSAGRVEGLLNEIEASRDEIARTLRLLALWIGTDDFLLGGHRAFVEGLRALGVEHEARETEGAHTWLVWRGYLRDLALRLFREA